VAEVTELLRAANDGSRQASDELFTLVYDDLKRIARNNLYRTGRPHELDATPLVHESFLRLAGGRARPPEGRMAFYSYVGKVMRSIVLDTIRKRQAIKRGGDCDFVTLTKGIAEQTDGGRESIALGEALSALGTIAPELMQLVELRYFAGLTLAEIGSVSGRSARSIERDWEKARMLLRALIEERECHAESEALHA
jgi:RNA polymerase sigma factor (TIGR02999 family)